MARKVDQETVVTYTCDGCGDQDVQVLQDGTGETNILPPSWGVLFVIQGGRDYDFTRFDSNPCGNASSAKHTLEVYTSGTREFPGRKILTCPLCVKKLGVTFQQPLKEPLKTPFPPKKPGIWARIRGVFWPLTLLPYYLPGSKLALPKEEEEKPS